jgi:long-subunit acyl-CoA synthetase (AMP-forming)
MTEMGMALSNPLQGPRVPGAVGIPLPGMEIRLVRDTSSTQTAAAGRRRDSSDDEASVGHRHGLLGRQGDGTSTESGTGAAGNVGGGAHVGAVESTRPWGQHISLDDMEQEDRDGRDGSGEGGRGVRMSASGGYMETGGHVEAQAGEIAARGDTLFKEYWRNPEATAVAFDSDGFFLTGAHHCRDHHHRCMHTCRSYGFAVGTSPRAEFRCPSMHPRKTC